jgi:hypothetical protein
VPAPYQTSVPSAVQSRTERKNCLGLGKTDSNSLEQSLWAGAQPRSDAKGMASLTRHGLPCLVRGGAGSQISISIACLHGFGNTASGIIAPVWRRRSANDEAPAKGGVGWVDFLGRGKWCR